MNVIESFSITDTILENYKEIIKGDFVGYRNHVTRMLNFCHYLKPDMSDEQSKKLQIAAAFHDIGLWTHDRVDYLDPSVEVCMEYLDEQGLSDWKEEVTIIIDMHHFIRAYKGEYQELTEVFRQADLVDFSWGLVKFGISKQFIAEVKSLIPNAGFHKTLVRFTGIQLTRNPFNPAPMMRYRSKYTN